MEKQLTDTVARTRVGIFLCGLLGVILTACFILPDSAVKLVRTLDSRNYYTQIPVLFSVVMAPGISLSVSFYVMSKSSAIADHLFPDAQPSSEQIEAAIYRVALTAVAILIFAETLPNFVHAFGLTLIENYYFDEAYGIRSTFSLLNIPFLVAFFLRIGIATYLLLGAPYFVSWQMDRSIENESRMENLQFDLLSVLIVVTIIALALGMLINGLRFDRILY